MATRAATAGRTRPPAPLLALLVVVALFGGSWALVTPAWQAPDEDVHFAYVQTLAEKGELPGGEGGPVSAAQIASQRALNTDATTKLPFARPELSRAAWEDYRDRVGAVPSDDGGGRNTASGYPPAYYLFGSIGYRVAGSKDVLASLYATRLISVLLLLVTTTAVWLLIGELFGRRRELQLVGAAAVGLWPMLGFISAAVNPDSMVYATWSLALWLGVRAIRRGFDARTAIAFGAVVAVALLAKATSLALLPAAAFALLVGLGRLVAQGKRGQALAVAAAALAAFLVPVLGWDLYLSSQDRAAYQQASAVAGPALNVRDFLSYVWQFYLPRLPFQEALRLDNEVISSYPAYNVWVASGWAAFGWVTLYLPQWAYSVFLALTATILAAAGIKGLDLLRRHRRSPEARRAWLPVVAFLALALTGLAGGLHLAEYSLRSPTNQGRYLFPIAGLGAATLVLALTLVPERFRRVAIGTVLGGLVSFELVTLGFVGSHYYA